MLPRIALMRVFFAVVFVAVHTCSFGVEPFLSLRRRPGEDGTSCRFCLEFLHVSQAKMQRASIIIGDVEPSPAKLTAAVIEEVFCDARKCVTSFVSRHLRGPRPLSSGSRLVLLLPFQLSSSAFSASSSVSVARRWLFTSSGLCLAKIICRSGRGTGKPRECTQSIARRQWLQGAAVSLFRGSLTERKKRKASKRKAKEKDAKPALEAQQQPVRARLQIQNLIDCKHKHSKSSLCTCPGNTY